MSPTVVVARLSRRTRRGFDAATGQLVTEATEPRQTEEAEGEMRCD
jgi:hypothetical protein